MRRQLPRPRPAPRQARWRSRSFLAAAAIDEYLDVNEWQIAGIKRAIASLDRREGIHAIRALRSTVHGFAALEIAGGFGIPLDVDKSFDWLVSALLKGLSSAQMR